MIESLKALYRAGFVKRAHAIDTLHVHTIAEHCYGMGCVVVYLCKMNDAEDCLGPLLQAVLYHDAPESHTGDVPAHIKKNSAAIEHALAEIETMWRLGVDLKMPELTEWEAALLDVADRIDLCMLCAHEHMMGNNSAQLRTVFARAQDYAMSANGKLGPTEKLKGLDELLEFVDEAWHE